MKMLEKRLWPNILYVLLLLLVCITLYGMNYSSSSSSSSDTINGQFYTLYTSNASYFYPTTSLPLDDYHHLINLTNFTFTIFNTPCNESAPLLLVMIHSAPSNRRRRDVIRSTWGKNTHQIKILFILGLASDQKLSKSIIEENERFSDIIQGSFFDSYRNITYKHVMVFKYAIYHCPQARYILKLDDDVFVNISFMLNFLNFDLSPFGGAKMLFCTIRKESVVARSWRSKWRVSFKEYPYKVYPPYCPGWALLYSPDVVFALYLEAQRADYFWIDDVHITGTLVEKIGLAHSDISHLVMPNKVVDDIVLAGTNYSQHYLYGAPNLDEKQIRVLWNYVRNRETPISVMKYE